MPHPPEHKQGFTLLEISIVLVIVGLIIGGILVGKEMIYAAEIRATLKQVEQFNAAMNTFKLKYGCISGDCANANQFGFTTPTSPHVPVVPADGWIGDGDGMINNNSSAEFLTAFWWLRNAGLLTGSITENTVMFGSPITNSFVLAALNGGQQGYRATWTAQWIDSTGNLGNEFLSGANAGAGHYFWLTSDMYTSTAILPMEAQAIDSKLDDGLPRSGQVLASGNIYFDTGPSIYAIPVADPTGAVYGTPDVGPAGANSDFCVTNDAIPKYNVLNKSRRVDTNTGVGSLCTLTVKASF
ncbi:MAG: prepilin-type N-terminal cleavage/methylation domain-containing protein [Alphaproteobacteria bacterium]|nr:prepilin-type N-terminal cleavage/methylation domain-containing protein [Alphaproteobacteria bacterium]